MGKLKYIVIATFSLLILNISIFGQTTTIFNETVGTPSSTTSINTYTGWSSSGLTFTGSGDVRNTTVSSGYTGASGGGNVFLTNTGATNFQIANINTSNYSSLSLSFGVYKSTTTSNGSELTVQVSTDGTNYTNLSFTALPTGSGTATWALRTASGTIPSTANLRIRFVNTSTTTQFRLDDIKLTGVLSLPNLSINDVSLNEGNSGTTSFTFTVSLSSNAPAGGVTFDIATADGTAAQPGDYAQKSLTSQTIPAGSSTYSFTVLVNGDTVFEPNETFFVNVTNVTGATVTDNQGQGTIQNDDSQPAISINDVSTNEGNSGTTNFVFTISLSNASSQNITVNYATADGTAIAPGDYMAASNTATITAGNTSTTVTISVNGDTTFENNENFFVNLTSPANATISDGQGQGTIVNDDADTIAPVISYTPLAAKETASMSMLVVTVTDNAAVQSVSITYAIGAGTPQVAACTSAGGSTYNCLIDETGAAGQLVGYYVSATDTAGNTSRNPSAANDGYAIGTVGIQGGTYDALNILSGTLNGNVIINSNFSYSGVVSSNGGTLEIGCDATLDTGNPDKFINAAITKDFCSASQTFTYPLGNTTALNNLGVAGFYTPLTVNITSVTGPSGLTAGVTDSRMSGADPANSISRYWTLTESGSITADLTFQYDAGDVTGNESAFKVIKNENGATTSFSDSTVDTNNHTATVTGISDFSLWSVGMLSPLAADASISGRVLDSNGNGISKVRVKVSGGDLDEPLLITTNSFGYFSFEVSAGQTYVVTVNSKNYGFSNPTQVISVNDNVDDLTFTADER